MRKTIGKALLLIIGSAVIGTLLLTICFLIPINNQNVEKSKTQLAKEEWHPGEETFVLDNWTDYLMIDTAAHTIEQNALHQALNMPNLWVEEGYTRYWHGYTGILRPLLLFFSYQDIRILNMMLQLFLTGTLAYIMGKKKGLRYIYLLLTAYALLTPSALWQSLQFSWIFYISYGSCLVLLLHQNHFSGKNRIFLAFCMIGILTCYFDLLTYPLITWAFPLLWWIAMSDEAKKTGAWLKDVIVSGIFWLCGYAGMWAMKWTLSTLVLGKNVFQEAFDSILARSSTDASREISDRLYAVTTNWLSYTYIISAILLGIWLIWIVWQSFSKNLKQDSRFAAVALIGSASFFWYLVLSSHTLVHTFFTYRIYNTFILAVLMLFVFSFQESGSLRSQNRQHLLLILLGWGAAFCIGVFPSLLARSECYVINGASAYNEVAFPPNTVFEMEFNPTFTQIIQFQLAINTESDMGNCHIELYKGDSLISQNTIPMADYKESYFLQISENWNFRKNTTYKIRVEIEGTEETSYLLITKPEEPRLAEYGKITLGDQPLDGEPISAFLYRRLPEKNILIFIWLTWGTVCFAGLLPGMIRLSLRSDTGHKRRI